MRADAWIVRHWDQVQPVLERLTSPYARRRQWETWPVWLGLAQGIAVPSVPAKSSGPLAAIELENRKIRILLELLESTFSRSGDIAECGVFRGGSLFAMALWTRKRAPGRRILGFDSFEGFDQSVEKDIALGGPPTPAKRVGGFRETSYERMLAKTKRLGLSDSVLLVRGYFQKTLMGYSDRRFSFVHLDCDLYDSYKTCLEFFYPRLAPGGVMLFDEYESPNWPGAALALDEFLKAKPEKLESAVDGPVTKYYFRKGA